MALRRRYCPNYLAPSSLFGASLGYQLGAILGVVLHPLSDNLVADLWQFYVGCCLHCSCECADMVAIHALKETDNRDLDKVV